MSNDEKNKLFLKEISNGITLNNMKIIQKGEYKIPERVGMKEKETESMINDEDERLKRFQYKNLTYQQKQNLINSRFEKYFLLKKKKETNSLTPTQNLIKGLSKRNHSSQRTFVNSRLITSRHLNLIDPLNYFFKEKIEIKEKYYSCKIHNKRKILSNLSIINLYKGNGSQKDLNEMQRKNLKSSVNIDKINEYKSIKENSFQSEDDEMSNIFNYNKKFSFKNINFQSENEKFNDDNELNNNIFLFKSRSDLQLNYNNNDCDNEDNEDNDINSLEKKVNDIYEMTKTQNENVLFDMLINKERLEILIYSYRSMSEENKEKFSDLIAKGFEKYIINKKTKMKIIYFIKEILPDNHVLKLIDSISDKLIKISMTNKYMNIINLFENIKERSYIINNSIIINFLRVNDVISIFNNKNSKFVIEYFLKKYKKYDFIYKLTTIIDNNIITFSLLDSATFIVQTYIKEYKPLYENLLIKTNNLIKNIEILASSRNGVFFLMTILNTYSFDKTKTLIDEICNISNSLSKLKYSSTLIEYCLKTYPFFRSDYIKINKDFFKELIEDSNGNFIIQKLLIVIENAQEKMNFLGFLLKIVKKIKRIPIQNKWNMIIKEHINEKIDSKSSIISIMKEDLYNQSSVKHKNKYKKKGIYENKDNKNNKNFNINNDIDKEVNINNIKKNDMNNSYINNINYNEGIYNNSFYSCNYNRNNLVGNRQINEVNQNISLYPINMNSQSINNINTISNTSNNINNMNSMNYTNYIKNSNQFNPHLYYNYNYITQNFPFQNSQMKYYQNYNNFYKKE